LTAKEQFHFGRGSVRHLAIILPPRFADSVHQHCDPSLDAQQQQTGGRVAVR
jgi:hypothetical protein